MAADFEAMKPRAGFLGHQEIAHAIVLPPPHDDQGRVRVLFMNRSACGKYNGSGGTGNHSYFWDLSDPGVVTRVFGPTHGYQGTSDLFCSGHAVNADGGVIVAGGLNYPLKCESTATCITENNDNDPNKNLPVGHRVAFRLDTSVDPPEWVSDQTWPVLLQREHWYPTVTAMHDGTLGIKGHFGAPSPDCQIPDWPYGSEAATHFYHELLDPSGGQAHEALNLLWTTAEECNEEAYESVGEYPRSHLASTGQWVHLDGNRRDQSGEIVNVTRMMNLLDPPCTQNLRWERSTGNQRPVVTHGSNTVHFVLLDDESSTGMRDVFYLFGGIDGHDSDPCHDQEHISNTAWRLKVEGAADAGVAANLLAADWVQVASMANCRVNSNAVLLPTGAVGLFGGTDDECDPVLAVEAFFPVELFGGSDSGSWKTWAEQLRAREYHSVAGLLPDGRPFSAGGNTPHHGSYHGMEIFAPAYMPRGDRPIITSWPDPDPEEDGAIEYGGEFKIGVTLGCEENDLDRVVLLRSTAASHAFDMNQRYVELAFDITDGAFPNFELTVQSPPSGFAAPPGRYLLFVIDAKGLPSVGRWVRVALPEVE